MNNDDNSFKEIGENVIESHILPDKLSILYRNSGQETTITETGIVAETVYALYLEDPAAAEVLCEFWIIRHAIFANLEMKPYLTKVKGVIGTDLIGKYTRAMRLYEKFITLHQRVLLVGHEEELLLLQEEKSSGNERLRKLMGGEMED